MSQLRLELSPSRADGAGFGQALIRALAAPPPGSLPLRAACSQGGIVDESDLHLSLLHLEPAGERVLARVGVFFGEVVGGCNCHDDPVVCPGYCVLGIAMERADGRADIRPLAE